MALLQKNGKFRCLFCDFTHGNNTHVYSHMSEAHDYMLVPFTREQLVKLQQFIMTKNDSLITPDIYEIIKLYAKYKIKSISDIE